GVEATQALLARGVEFDGLFALNDTLGFGALRALEQRGLSVPEDVAVIGFDNVDESAYSIPALTTIEPGREWIAREAVSLLPRRIEDPRAEARTVFAGYRIIEHETSP